MNKQKQKALELLRKGKSDSEVAKELGLRRETVWRWRQGPEFAGSLSDAKNDCIKVASETLIASVPEAVDVLGKVMRDELVPVQARLRAACEMLDRALQLHREYPTAPEDSGATIEDLFRAMHQELPQEAFLSIVEAAHKGALGPTAQHFVSENVTVIEIRAPEGDQVQRIVHIVVRGEASQPVQA